MLICAEPEVQRRPPICPRLVQATEKLRARLVARLSSADGIKLDPVEFPIVANRVTV